MEFKATKINLTNLSIFLASANTGEPQIVDIKNDKTSSKGYPSTTKWIQFHQQDTKEIFTFDEKVPEKFIFRYASKNLSWLKSRVDLYIDSGITELAGSIVTENSQDNLIYPINKINFTHKSMKMSSKSSELSYINPLEDDKWKLFSDISNPMVSFDMSPIVMERISKLISIDKNDIVSEKTKEKSEVVRLLIQENGIKFSSREDDRWDAIFDQSEINITINPEFVGKVIAYPSDIFNRLQKGKLYKCYVCFNQNIGIHTIVNILDENNINMNSSMLFDPNM
jgi:hypothetical protein